MNKVNGSGVVQKNERFWADQKSQLTITKQNGKKCFSICYYIDISGSFQQNLDFSNSSFFSLYFFPDSVYRTFKNLEKKKAKQNKTKIWKKKDGVLCDNCVFSDTIKNEYNDAGLFKCPYFLKCNDKILSLILHHDCHLNLVPMI